MNNYNPGPKGTMKVAGGVKKPQQVLAKPAKLKMAVKSMVGKPRPLMTDTYVPPPKGKPVMANGGMHKKGGR